MSEEDENVKAHAADHAKRVAEGRARESARETAQILTGAGLGMVKIDPGFAQSEAIRRMTELIAAGTLRHGGDPILAWMADHAVFRDGPQGQKRLDKEASPEKIDGIAALVMGIDGAVVRRPREPEPEYQVMTFGGVRA